MSRTPPKARRIDIRNPIATAMTTVWTVDSGAPNSNVRPAPRGLPTPLEHQKFPRDAFLAPCSACFPDAAGFLAIKNAKPKILKGFLAL
jgi:hypothetical protein